MLKEFWLNKKKVVDNIKQKESNLMMLEEQKSMLSNIGTCKDLICCNQAIKAASKNMDIDDFESLKENMDEINDDQEELKDFFKDYKNEEEDMNEELDLIEQDMDIQSKIKENIENNNKKEEED